MQSVLSKCQYTCTHVHGLYRLNYESKPWVTLNKKLTQQNKPSFFVNDKFTIFVHTICS